MNCICGERRAASPRLEDNKSWRKRHHLLPAWEAFAEDFGCVCLPIGRLPGYKTDGGASLTSYRQFLIHSMGCGTVAEPLDSTPEKDLSAEVGFVTVQLSMDISASACYDSITHIYDDTGKS